MYNYLKEKFPNIIEPRIDKDQKYRWRLEFGCMVGRIVDICLIKLDHEFWSIDATRKISYEGRLNGVSVFKYTCTTQDDLGKFILDKIGECLEDFSNYRKRDDEQHSGDTSLANYRIIEGEGAEHPTKL